MSTPNLIAEFFYRPGMDEKTKIKIEMKNSICYVYHPRLPEPIVVIEGFPLEIVGQIEQMWRTK